MEEKIKNALRIVINLYKHDRLLEEELFTLLEVIMEKEKISTTYYPITIPQGPEPFKNPWIDTPWYDKHWTTTTTNKLSDQDINYFKDVTKK